MITASFLHLHQTQPLLEKKMCPTKLPARYRPYSPALPPAARGGRKLSYESKQRAGYPLQLRACYAYPPPLRRAAYMPSPPRANQQPSSGQVTYPPASTGQPANPAPQAPGPQADPSSPRPGQAAYPPPQQPGQAIYPPPAGQAPPPGAYSAQGCYYYQGPPPAANPAHSYYYQGPPPAAHYPPQGYHNYQGPPPVTYPTQGYYYPGPQPQPWGAFNAGADMGMKAIATAHDLGVIKEFWNVFCW